MERERPRREKLAPVSDQMRAWSSALAAELAQWPCLTQNPSLGSPRYIAVRPCSGCCPGLVACFKKMPLHSALAWARQQLPCALENDQRIAVFDKEKTRWFSFELTCDADLHDALDYLGRAYQGARIRRKNN